MIGRILFLAGGLMLLGSVGLAQQPAAQTPMTFRLTPGDRNPSACTTADASMSREQHVTVAGDIAVLTSNGGINDKAKQTAPGIYKTRWSAGGITYDIEVNTTASPAQLNVAETKLGCKWSGKAS